MSKIQIQFHCEPDEAVTLAKDWARDHDLAVVVEQFSPDYKAVMWSRGDVPDPSRLERVDRVALCRQDPDLKARTAHEFVSRNGGCLFLSIGPREDAGLRESALGAGTEDQEMFQAWTRVIRQAKSGMHKGAVVRDPHSGSAQTVRNHLHTPGAHELAKQGVKMLAAAGWNYFDFDDCTETAR